MTERNNRNRRISCDDCDREDSFFNVQRLCQHISLSPPRIILLPALLLFFVFKFRVYQSSRFVPPVFVFIESQSRRVSSRSCASRIVKKSPLDVKKGRPVRHTNGRSPVPSRFRSPRFLVRNKPESSVERKSVDAQERGIQPIIRRRSSHFGLFCYCYCCC